MYNCPFVSIIQSRKFWKVINGNQSQRYVRTVITKKNLSSANYDICIWHKLNCLSLISIPLKECWLLGLLKTWATTKERNAEIGQPCRMPRFILNLGGKYELPRRNECTICYQPLLLLWCVQEYLASGLKTLQPTLITLLQTVLLWCFHDSVCFLKTATKWGGFACRIKGRIGNSLYSAIFIFWRYWNEDVRDRC